jgi:hypothetical protein
MGTRASQLLRFGAVPKANRSANLLTTSLDRLDIGEVWEAKGFRWTLPVTNCSEQDLKIKEWGGSCNCTAISPSSLTIPAGETREITVVLDLTDYKQTERNTSIRTFSAEIVPVVCRMDGVRITTVGWNLQGRIRSALGLERTEVDFGRWSECANRPQPHSIKVVSLTPLSHIVTRCRVPALNATIRRDETNSSLFHL